ncbi:MAG: glycosyl transferase [Glaciihabitans sp.]|nr:glycosyl transferase [Glaciihabitans sp.]
MGDTGPKLRIAMFGTRGVPAAYSGFETAVEEVGRRLVERGHEVTVYCRTKTEEKPKEYLGMKLVHLPALRSKTLETLSHTGFSAIHAFFHRRQDISFVFNAANAPFLPLIRWRRVPVAVHVDGLEWKRGKWSNLGKQYYRRAEQYCVRWGDALISDAQGIADYYTREFGIESALISYGSKILRTPKPELIEPLGLKPGGYHLVVARFEPENHVDLIVEGYSASDARLPLVVVGSAPYAAEYTDRIAAVAATDPRIHMLGGVWDQDLLDQLYANSLEYFHGHSVGGTNPSLLRAMGAGAAVAAFDVSFNREVLGDDGSFFRDAADVAERVVSAESRSEELRATGERLQARAERNYDWDAVATGYEELAQRLMTGYSTRGKRSGSRSGSTWSDETAASPR